MSRDTDIDKDTRPKPRFMYSTEASRAQKLPGSAPFRRPAGATPRSSPVSRRQQLIQRASERLTSFSASKPRSSRLPISSPIPSRLTGETSPVLASPSPRDSHLPEPVKKAPIDSPTTAEKPLPSLPVATFTTSSPIHRRSLIDATERPLKRAVSPGVLEDWPTLSPVNQAPELCREAVMKSNEGTPIKPSLGESIMERMQNLKLSDDANGHLNNVRQESVNKVNVQDHTPKIASAPRQSEPAELPDSNFLAPRRAPETPTESKRASTSSSLGKRASLKALNVLKTRRSSKFADGNNKVSESNDDRPPTSYVQHSSLAVTSEDGMNGANHVHGQAKVPANADRPLLPSSIPRPAQHIASATFPNVVPSSPTAKIVQLKTTGNEKTSSSQEEGITAPPADEKCDVEAAWGIGRDKPCATPVQGQCDVHAAWGISKDYFADTPSKRQSSLPVPARKPAPPVHAMTMLSTWMRPEVCDGIQENGSASSDSDTTIQEEPGTLQACPAAQQFVDALSSPQKEKDVPGSSQDEDHVSRMRSFKFPQTPLQENNGVEESPKPKSISTAAGTIYAEDEHGSFRTKPVLNADPKHGPRVRIDASADRLFLSDEDLAQTEAKREAYQRKYSAGHISGRDDKPVIPELESLRAVGGGDAQDGSPSKGNRKIERKLAPQIPENIPGLSHSPIGWPVQYSKIAPFAEVTFNKEPPTSEKRRSVSESNLREAVAAIGTPQRTPASALRDDAPQPSPTSVHTIRTALRRGPPPTPTDHNNIKTTKCRKSFPDLAGRPSWPPRTSSKNGGINKDQPHHKLGDKFNMVYASQRAEFTPSATATQAPTVTVTATVSDKDGPGPATPTQNQPKYMQSYNRSLRHLNAHSNTDTHTDMPSSPLIVPGSVHTGKGVKVMSNIKGLFHKTSSDKLMNRSDSRRSVSGRQARPGSGMNGSGRSPNTHTSTAALAGSLANGIRSGSETFRPSPLRSPIAAETLQAMTENANAHPHNVPSSISKRKFPRLPSHLGAKDKDKKAAHSHSHPAPASPYNKQPNLSGNDSNIGGSGTATSTAFLTSALEPHELRTATSLAFTLLDRARDASHSSSHLDATDPQKDSLRKVQERYVELAKVLVSMVGMARDAEKAMEEARQAAGRAEMEVLKARGAVGDVVGLVDALLSSEWGGVRTP